MRPVPKKILNNIKLHLRSDVPLELPYQVELTLDCLCMRILEPSSPYTPSVISLKTHQNLKKWIDIVNQHTSAIPHQIVSKPSEFLSDLDDLIASQGEPFGSTSIYMLSCLSINAKKRNYSNPRRARSRRTISWLYWLSWWDFWVYLKTNNIKTHFLCSRMG